MQRRHSACGRGGIDGQVSRRHRIAFNRCHGRAASRSPERQQPGAGIQIEHHAAGRNRLGHVRHQRLEKKSVALEERQHVACQGDTLSADRQPIGDVRFTDGLEVRSPVRLHHTERRAAQ